MPSKRSEPSVEMALGEEMVEEGSALPGDDRLEEDGERLVPPSQGEPSETVASPLLSEALPPGVEAQEVDESVMAGYVPLEVPFEVALALSEVIDALRQDRRFFQRVLGWAGSLQQSPRQGPLTDLIRTLAGQEGLSQETAMQRLGRVARGGEQT